MPATSTHCPYCAFQCGLLVTPNGAGTPSLRVVGDPTFPVNNGQTCIKGLRSGDLIDHPARLRTPMLRGESGQLAPVSWDTALDFVANRLIDIRREHGAPAL